MSLYLIGDVQGCLAPFERLLELIDFSPSRDKLVVLGDLVNRGPDSLAVLRRFMRLGTSANCLMGNHDLHLLAVSQGVRLPHKSDTLQAIVEAPDASVLLDWVRERPLALYERGWLMVHAGVLPQWSRDETLQRADEVSRALQGPEGLTYLQHMYGNQPDHWRDDWPLFDRWRVIVNALTRLRFCTADGTMEFNTKEGAGAAPAGFMPWFEVPNRRTQDTPIAFGHWSTLGLRNESHLLALDTGCVWGGHLSAAKIHLNGTVEKIAQIKCPQALRPKL
jgi:bis(5'-nucleosyl)-tetraphosphatase (symmetrical)